MRTTRPHEPSQPGFFGKLPMRGDFVTRRVEGRLKTAIDEWLSVCITTGQRLLGTAWSDAYTRAPPWRFGLAAGVLGPNPVLGLLVPSTDRYLRQFPLMVMVELLGEVPLLRFVCEVEPWFAAAEAAVAEALGPDGTLDGFDSRVSALGRPMLPPRSSGDDATGVIHRSDGPETLLEAALSERSDTTTVWWTLGGGGLTPMVLRHHGLPTPERFVALLDGQWQRWGWGEDSGMDVNAAPECSLHSHR